MSFSLRRYILVLRMNTKEKNVAVHVLQAPEKTVGGRSGPLCHIPNSCANHN